MFYDRRDRYDPRMWSKRFVFLAVLEDREGKWYQRLALCRTVWSRLSDRTLDIAGRRYHRYEHRDSLPSAA